ncbi:MAG: hypothetical protein F6J86_19105 [Symploca sp. SIO1B1]|nr:hypothetical protein [Symploca sp. SIO1B1]
MQSKILSLVHQIRKPTVERSKKSPLLLMLHSIFSNEEELMSFVHMIDGRFCVVSARGPIVLRSGAYAWFPMKFKKSGNNCLLKDLEACRFLLIDFIDELIEAYGLDSKQIYLMGFSQGAAISFSLAFTIPSRIAGVVAINGRLGNTIINQMCEQNLVDSRGLESLPTFVAFGVNDPIVSIVDGRVTRDHLQKLRVTLDYREYPIGHELNSMVIEDSATWLSSQLDCSLRSVIPIC